VPGTTQEFAYTGFGLPKTVVTQGSNGTIALSYAADGSRALTDTAGTDRYHFDRLYERTVGPAGVIQRRFRIYAGGREVAELTRDGTGALSSTVVKYVHLDAGGSFSAVTDASGGVVARRAYSPFGKLESAPSPADDVRAGFAGHDYDDVLGMVDMRGRLYDPLVGRFTTPDPILDSPFSGRGNSRYTYAWNNPLRYVDPSGHQALENPEWGVHKKSDTVITTVDRVYPAPPIVLPANVNCGNANDVVVQQSPTTSASSQQLMDWIAGQAAGAVPKQPQATYEDMRSAMELSRLREIDKPFSALSIGPTDLGAGLVRPLARRLGGMIASKILSRRVAEGAAVRQLVPSFGNLGDDQVGIVAGELTTGPGGYTVAGELAEGSYDVVVQEGKLIVGKGHAFLAGGERVTYAGEARFIRGQITEWTNVSGHIRPVRAFAGSAGLPMDLFRPVVCPSFAGLPQLPVFQ
jgi:RHS repeat-associated protein